MGILLATFAFTICAVAIALPTLTTPQDHAGQPLRKRTAPHYDPSLTGPHLDALNQSVSDSLLLALTAFNTPTSGTSFGRYFRPSDSDIVHRVFQTMIDTDLHQAIDPSTVGPPEFTDITFYDGDSPIYNECASNPGLIAFPVYQAFSPSGPDTMQVHLCPKFFTLPVPGDVSCDEAATWSTAKPAMVYQGSILLHMYLLLDTLTRRANAGDIIGDYQGAIGPWEAMMFKNNAKTKTPRENADNFHWWALEVWWMHRCGLGEFQDPPQDDGTAGGQPYLELPGQ
ncbi:MAG: hypothetical protein Q9160_006568 [Pyrenula sp. 1 TL-2023]